MSAVKSGQHTYTCNFTRYITPYNARNDSDGRPSHANIQQDTIFISPYACPLWRNAEIFLTRANIMFVAPVVIKTGHGMMSPSCDMF
jgi:hypothetical protein